MRNVRTGVCEGLGLQPRHQDNAARPSSSASGLAAPLSRWSQVDRALTGPKARVPLGIQHRAMISLYWEFSLPLDWSVDPFEDRNWEHHLHSWRNMEYWLHQYRREGDIASLLIPIEIVLDWHRFHVEEGRTSEFQWYDHSTGVRASRLAFLLELILSDQIVVNDT